MGVAWSTNINTVKEDIRNEVIQTSNNLCKYTCSNTLDNVNVIVDRQSKIGNVTIRQECDVDALCLLKSNLVSKTSNESEVDQEIDSSTPGKLLMITGQLSVSNTIKQIENVTTQAISNVCDISGSNMARNLNFFIADNSTGGNIDIDQSVLLSSSCEVEASSQNSSDNVSKTVQKNHQLANIIITVTFFIVFLIGMGLYYYYETEQAKIESAYYIEQSRIQADKTSTFVNAVATADEQASQNLKDILDIYKSKQGIPITPSVNKTTSSNATATISDAAAT